MEALLVPDDLDGHVVVRLVVERANHLPETALANHLEDLVAVRDVVMAYLVVAAVVVVVAAVEHRARLGVDLARVQSQVPDLCVLFNLLLLVVGHAVAVEFDGLWKDEERGLIIMGKLCQSWLIVGVGKVKRETHLSRSRFFGNANHLFHVCRTIEGEAIVCPRYEVNRFWARTETVSGGVNGRHWTGKSIMGD